MKSLFVALYLAIMGSLLVVMLSIEALQNFHYEEEIGTDYLNIGQAVAELAKKLSIDSPQALSENIQWLTQNFEIIHKAELVNKTGNVIQNEKMAKIESFVFEETSDSVQVLVPLNTSQSLRINFVDAYSSEYSFTYYLGVISIYASMAVVIFLITRMLYRYLERLRHMAAAVASGDDHISLPNSFIQPLHQLNQDMNHMVLELKQKTDENHLLTAAIHHELRIPLTRLRLALDMVQRSPKEDPERDNLLADMDEDLDDFSVLMEDILTISRLRIRSNPIEKTVLSVTDMVTKLCREESRNSKDICIETQFNMPFMLEFNRRLMERAIHNLITNAVKYANQRVRVSTQIESHQALLIIEDDGDGIPQEEHTSVFTPFYRLDNSRSRNSGGVGLGLAIVQLVIEQSKGKITIEQSDLGGAKFIVQWNQ
ncbi:MAG: ATP-binding protein [Bermanella sp.]